MTRPGDGWPALVLTAGLGTRLRPLSYVRAKPAVPVAGEPLIRRILTWLAAEGVRDVVLNLHYKPQTITAVVGDGTDLGLRVRYSYENPILGSAGGPRHALSLLDAPQFYIVNGDTLCDVDLGELASRHCADRARVTLALVSQPDSSRYGGVRLNDRHVVEGFVKRPIPSEYHFVGVQAVDADVFAGLREDRPDETVGRVYPALIARHSGSVRGMVSEARFQDIGTPADYLETSLALAQEERRALPLLGARSRLEDGACVEESVLWDDVVVGAGAQVRRCVVADGVRIPAGAQFNRSAIVRRPLGYSPGSEESLVGDLLVRPL